MNQVAVVIGGGQTLGAFLCRGLAEEGYRVAVVDIQSDKAANVAQEINADLAKVWRTVWRRRHQRAERAGAFPRRRRDFGRVDLLVTARVSPKRRLSAISSWAILTARYR